MEKMEAQQKVWRGRGEQRVTEAPLGSHAGQQGRCGLGVSERQEVRESPHVWPVEQERQPINL